MQESSPLSLLVIYSALRKTTNCYDAVMEELLEKYLELLSELPDVQERDAVDWTLASVWGEIIDDLRIAIARQAR